MFFIEYSNDFWHKSKNYNFDPYFCLLLQILPQWLKTGFVVQGHISQLQNLYFRVLYCGEFCNPTYLPVVYSIKWVVGLISTLYKNGSCGCQNFTIKKYGGNILCFTILA